MRLSLTRIVAQTSPICNENCIRLQRRSLFISNLRRPTSYFQYRGYADDIKNPEADESPGVESTDTVPDDPDIITTESPEIQNPPPSADPPSEASPASGAHKRAPKWRTKYSKRKSKSTQKSQSMAKPKQKDSAKAPKPNLLRTISETSLRRQLIWQEPLTGINPAYDMALHILQQDRAQKIEIINRLRKKLARERESISFL